MRIIWTGGGSGLGARALEAVLSAGAVETVWCGVHRRNPKTRDPRIKTFPFDLESPVIPAEARGADWTVHFAGVTHSADPERYDRINRAGTVALARETRCRRMLFVSTRCATAETGAYGASKLAAEAALAEMEWESLIFLRPSEVYGGGGREGVDRLVEFARRFHVAPAIFGSDGARFAPLHAEDFVEGVVRLLTAETRGIREVEFCGPEVLSGVAIAARLARSFGALPVPVWLPIVAGMNRFGIMLVAPDQIARLVGRKTSESTRGFPGDWRPSRRFFR